MTAPKLRFVSTIHIFPQRHEERKKNTKKENKQDIDSNRQTNKQNSNKLTGNTLVNKGTLIINHKNKHKQEAQMLSRRTFNTVFFSFFPYILL